MTVIDRYTRWPEAIPLKNIEAQTVARAFVHNWVARFGVPANITSDRGSQFTSELWSSMCKLLGAELHPTTAYHPQANGLIERFHRNLKASLKARLIGPNWMDELPWVLLGTRTTPKEDLNTSSAELVFGSPLTVPGDFIPNTQPVPVSEQLQQLRERVGSLRPIPTSAHGEKHNKSYVSQSLQGARFVFIRHDARKSPLQTPYYGPFEVISRSEKYFTLQIGNIQDTVSIDRLKLAYLDSSQPPQLAQPPSRGRPPKKSAQPMKQLYQKSKNNPTPSSHQVKPSYAEVTTRSGRSSKQPDRFSQMIGYTGGSYSALT